jgi:ABC-type lipopolysaccharide export system ATPase subunit
MLPKLLRKLLYDLNFTLPQAGIVGIGQTELEKSTIFRMIMGEQATDSANLMLADS